MEKKKAQFWQKIHSLRLNTKFTILILLLVFFPLVVLSLVLFYQIEQSSVQQIESDMYYRQRELESAISIRLEAIDMMQRSFSNNDALLGMLEASAAGETLSTRELLEFSQGIGSFLTQTVENNPVLYTVRVYSRDDYIQEIMPIVYKASRMENMSWSKENPVTGWHYSYYDTSFGSLTENGDVPLLGLVTPINDFTYGTIGYVEAATEMRTMFPAMYDDKSDSSDWSFFVVDGGEIYFGTHTSPYSEIIAESLLLNRAIKKEPSVKRESIAGREIVFFAIPISKMGGTYVGVTDITDIVSEVRMQRNAFFAVLVIIGIFMTFAVSGMVRGMLGRLYTVVENMRAIRHGDLSVRSDVEGTDEVGELAHQFNRMLDRIEQLTEENVQREILAKNAGIRSLQNQINAHFIYNVLESIKMLAEMNEEYAISDAITSLGKLLRYSMRWESGTVTLREELEYIENYLALMNFRNDFTINLAINLPEDMYRQEIPKMSLQPIVENSVIHGISDLGEDATIYIKGVEDENDVWIELSDNGQGMSKEALERLQMRLKGEVETEEISHKGHGVGIKNVADRIMLEFGREYGLTVASEEGKFTKTIMHLPKRKEKRNEIITNR
jgi:two-component system sensor histidine kinase YesM